MAVRCKAAVQCKAGVRRVARSEDSRSSRDRVRQDQAEHPEHVPSTAQPVLASSVGDRIPLVPPEAASDRDQAWVRQVCRLRECQAANRQDVPALLREGRDSAISMGRKKAR